MSPLHPSATLDDAHLMRRVADGDSGAFETLYDRYHAKAYAVAMRVTRRPATAEEVTQDAFVALWRNADRYDAQRGSLAAWLFTIVSSRGIDALRRSARHERHTTWDSGVPEDLEAAGRTDDEAQRHDDARHARRLIGALPVVQRQAIELSYFGGLTQVEIATRSGVPLGTVKSRARLALSKLSLMATREGLAV